MNILDTIARIVFVVFVVVIVGLAVLSIVGLAINGLGWISAALVIVLIVFGVFVKRVTGE